MASTSLDGDEGDVSPSLHVLDLPQLWQKPGGTDLLEVLADLSVVAPAFSVPAVDAERSHKKVNETGVPAYLTSIIASSLRWIDDEAVREAIWDGASLRLSERSGRTAMPAMTREFLISEDLTIRLHEPSLTGDNLGLKTWASALLLSKQLGYLQVHIPKSQPEVLELGAGTGLVGLSAACTWKTSVTLTDLDEIVPNLSRNLELNQQTVAAHGGSTKARALDWSNSSEFPSSPEQYDVIIAADPIYSPEHPKMLVDTISCWLRHKPSSRLIIELPLREHYLEERAQLQKLLLDAKFDLLVEGQEAGLDDWLDSDGKEAQVQCEWSIWKPTQ